MFFILKVFDRSVWVKRLSFLNSLESSKFIPFEKFVLDTRYTLNLLILTIIVASFGAVIYILISIVVGSEQVWNFFNLLRRIFLRHKVAPIPTKEQEPVVPTPTDSQS
jgi:hypothetical protein